MLPVISGDAEYVTVTNSAEVRMTLPKSAADVECTVELPKFEFAPIKKDERLGRILFSLDGIILCEVPLVAKYGVSEVKPKKNLFELITSIFN